MIAKPTVYPAVAVESAARCRFDLSFRRAEHPRPIEPGWLGGDPIDDARWPGRTSCGSWEHIPNSLPDTDDPDDWIDHYASMAIAQSLHEGLEWMHVDGELWLDPHDDRVADVVDQLAAGLAARLAELRRRNT